LGLRNTQKKLENGPGGHGTTRCVRCHSLVQKSILCLFRFFFFVESSPILISRSICQLKKRKVIFTQDYAGSYSMIIEEVEADTRNLQRASFKHENCASNSEVHRLARLAVSSSLGRQVWLLQPPGGLSIPNNVYDQ
jgi:hypothetical protein